MIILVESSGNHSNRLFQNIHFEAFCKEHGIEYINPSFFDMHKYYNEPCYLHKGIKGVLFLRPLFGKMIRKIKLDKLFFNDKFVSFDNEGHNSTALLPPPPP